MVDNRLVEYIKEQKNKGYALEQIKQLLISHRHDPNEVNQAISYVNSNDGSGNQKKVIIIVSVILMVLGLIMGLFYFGKQINTSPKLVMLLIPLILTLIMGGIISIFILALILFFSAKIMKITNNNYTKALLTVFLCNLFIFVMGLFMLLIGIQKISQIFHSIIILLIGLVSYLFAIKQIYSTNWNKTIQILVLFFGITIILSAILGFLLYFTTINLFQSRMASWGSSLPS